MKRQIFLLTLVGLSGLQAQTWQQLDPAGAPGGRAYADAVYLPHLEALAFFGGDGPNGPFNDLWIYDLAARAWQSPPILSAEVPPARFAHSAAFDPETRRMYIWGGVGADGQFFNDLWAFDFRAFSWLPLMVDGESAGVPPQRYGSSMIFYPRGKRLVVFGGFGNQGRLGDTWLFDLLRGEWTELKGGNPAPRRCLHRAVYAPDRQWMIIYGGRQDDNLGDIWALDLSSQAWLNLTPAQSPPARHFSGLIYAPDEKVRIFGGNGAAQGINAGARNDLWELSLNKGVWEEIAQTDTFPPPRLGHGVAYHPDHGMLIFGGQDAEGTYLNDLWQFREVRTSRSESLLEKQAQPYPNPFSYSLHLSLPLPPHQMEEISLFDRLGRKVADLELRRGLHTQTWELAHLPPGYYRLQVRAQGINRQWPVVKTK